MHCLGRIQKPFVANRTVLRERFSRVSSGREARSELSQAREEHVDESFRGNDAQVQVQVQEFGPHGTLVALFEEGLPMHITHPTPGRWVHTPGSRVVTFDVLSGKIGAQQEACP